MGVTYILIAVITFKMRFIKCRYVTGYSFKNVINICIFHGGSVIIRRSPAVRKTSQMAPEQGHEILKNNRNRFHNFFQYMRKTSKKLSKKRMLSRMIQIQWHEIENVNTITFTYYYNLNQEQGTPKATRTSETEWR